jgi:uncharacterized membrane protein
MKKCFFFMFPIYDYSTLVNSIAIFLEIAGFIIILVTVKHMRRTRSSDMETGFDHLPNVVSNTNPRLYFVGIVLVIVGLAGQFVAQGIRGGW